MIGCGYTLVQTFAVVHGIVKMLLGIAKYTGSRGTCWWAC